MAEHSIVEYIVDHSGHSCGYCHSSSSSYSHGLCWLPVCCFSVFLVCLVLVVASSITSNNITKAFNTDLLQLALFAVN